MPTYYEEENILKSQFLFISYSHEDKSIVHSAIDWLTGEGVRIWYDGYLRNGDRWENTAESIIKHENCVGVVFFNSCNSFVSDAVSNERKWSLEKQEQWEKNGKSFHIFVANIERPSTVSLIKRVFDMMTDDDIALRKAMPTKRLQDILTLFDDTRIYSYVDVAEPTAFLPGFLVDIQNRVPDVVNKSSVMIEKMKNSANSNVLGSSFVVDFGICKDKQVNILPEFMRSKDGTVAFRGESYIVSDGDCYSTKPITWMLIYTEDDVCVLISGGCVDVRCGGAELKRWLGEDFINSSFSAEQRALLIDGVSLLNPKDIECAVDDSFMKLGVTLNDAEKNWWIDEMGDGALQKVVREDGTVYHNGYNSRTKKCGVRPVIKMKISDLQKLV